MSESIQECPREREALAAVVAGEEPSPELARHVAGCAGCREVMAVSTWLRGVARETVVGTLPRADRVWWRAQVERRLEERRALAERAARPIRWFERVAAVALAGAAGGILWSQGLPTAGAAFTRLSDPAALGALTVVLLAVAAWTARSAARSG